MVNKDGVLENDRPEPLDKLVTWVFDEGTFKPAAKIIDGHSYSIVTNYLGTPVEMYNEAGEKTWEVEYDIYGKVRTLAKGSLNDCPFRYQGQYEDEETGLYYNRFRYYNADEGVYLSQDPIGLLGNNSNIYAFTRDSNILVDIFGLSECSFKPKDSYNGIKEASQILKDRGLPRNVRKSILEPFNKQSIKVRKAGADEFGIRFHDNGLKADANGRYLFETFPANRNSLAIKPDWNDMTAIKQWQIKEGTQMFEGTAAAQGNLSGGQIQKFIVDNPLINLF
ncbi:RHS repeat-associated core domain-containing protein [Cochleicola gelatinilyticus]|uniref:Teneurin-like YD-shell domain-containing protein n=1 Tax=Cochleicola gelatinilyticus TaxID=1763537 RepID=A0A167HL70_9FLAO|nr:RHS repeat-associated core domain-containing protein [Cochleicola gelatinilyticus]OAB78729.1 hypothetical protein ULVI_09105 [Cochleicola gelatinilyticus]